jgi:hypothetical protein
VQLTNHRLILIDMNLAPYVAFMAMFFERAVVKGTVRLD